jgi:membrane protease YdiL (CAAX protease family)
MEQSLNKTQPNTPSKVTHWRTDPFLLGFGLLYGTALITSFIVSKGWLSTLLLGLGIAVTILLVLFLARKYSLQPVDINRPYLECWIIMGWYIGFMFLSAIWKGEGLLANEFGKWLWFVIIPLVLLLVVRGRKTDMIAVLRSVGFHRHGMGKAALLGFLASAFMSPFVVLSLPASQLQKILEILQKPLNLLIVFPISFLLAFITAGFTEELFFRGIMQSRLAKVTGSEMRSCILVAFLFGIYHLPYAYFSPSWPTHGNIAWALSSVLTEQMITGLLLGVLWLRTHNIAAPILFHSMVNTLAVITMLKFG